jgi:large subunit ribosomal protein L3
LQRDGRGASAAPTTALAKRSQGGERDFIEFNADQSKSVWSLKMTMGLVGRKCGMTRVFTDEGESIPVTVIEAQPNRVTQVKTVDRDGYRALQVSAGSRKASRVSRPEAGHFAAAKVEAGDLMTEFRLDDADEADFELGGEVKVDLFEEGQKVDVVGTTIGKGFAGVIKRYNFSMQDATHGNSLAHRAPGSIGQNQTPGRVFKGKKMSGHMGNVQRTIQNLEIVRVDSERNLLLIKGAVPGSKGSRVIVRPAVKAKN